MKLTLLKSIITVASMFAATISNAQESPTAQQLVGTWFVEVGGILPDGGKYQNIMNVDEGGTADIVGGFMFGAAGIAFTDSPASVVKVDGDEFEIRMFAFLADPKTGVPNSLNVTVYRGTMLESGKSFSAEADLYYLPCDMQNCPAPDPDNLGAPAVVAEVTGSKLATPFEPAFPK